MLNIPSTVNDPKFRYKMPKMQVKIESKGNGIKTNIVNLGDVAKHLRTNEQYILKWFGFQKASQTTFKQAGGKNNTNYIINGQFTEEDLRKVLDKFIQKYVCCPKCKLPEMYLTVNGEKINGKCDSCPFVGELDNKHKLASFITKNPPIFQSQASKVIKVEAEKTSNKTHAQKKQSKKQEVVQDQVITFNPHIMDFGSQQLENFIIYLRKFIENLKNQDFDIKSAKIVHKVKPLGLKKPLVAYSIFKAFFTVNITNQLQENSKLYLNLVKKLVIVQTQLQTLLNLEFLFLQANKEKDFTKFLPTILYNVVKEGLLSQKFLVQWSNQSIKDIDTNFLYNASRDALFKKAVQDYLDSLDQQEEEQEETGQKVEQKPVNEEQKKQEQIKA